MSVGLWTEPIGHGFKSKNRSGFIDTDRRISATHRRDIGGHKVSIFPPVEKFFECRLWVSAPAKWAANSLKLLTPPNAAHAKAVPRYTTVFR